MKLNCNVIQDLLPLYVDQVCSEESKELIDEHLMECKECSKLLHQMGSSEIETDLKSEAEDVIRHQAKFFKRKSAIAGAVFAGIFMLPILVCLLVNLATGSIHDWFFVVMGSMLVAASLFVVPFLIPESKLFWMFVTFTASLLLLFGIICLYTGGSWFFVALFAVLFGFSVCFLPFAVYAKPMRRLLGKQKGLTVMTIITMLYIVMIISISITFYSNLNMAIVISIPIIVLAWVIFLLIRYPKCNGLIKGGICTMIFGIFGCFADCFMNTWQGNEMSLPVFRPFIWNLDTISDNVAWLFLIVGVSVGLILIIAGVIMERKKRE